MKKIVCLLLVAVYSLIANPVVLGLDITEFKFDSQNNWQLEIKFNNYTSAMDFDSLVIFSSSGHSKINSNVLGSSQVYHVVENTLNCLNRLLELNPVGDQIELRSYLMYLNGQYQSDYINYGAGSSFADLQPTQSIAYIEDAAYQPADYALDNTPNLGGLNNSSGAVGQLSGSLTAQNGNLMPNTTFVCNGFRITTDNTGHYNKNLLAKQYSTSFLNIISPNTSNTAFNPPVTFSIKPDSVKNFNFNLSVLDISDQPSAVKSSALLYNYPNPFNNQTAIYYEVPEGLKYKNATIRISNIKGEAVAVLAANQKSGSVYWNADHNSAGMYIYQLLIDGKAVKSGEMVLLK